MMFLFLIVAEHKQPLHNIFAFPIVSYKGVKVNIKSISTKDECDLSSYVTWELCLTKMQFEIITCIIDLFI